jgi:hypothetical protein
MKKCLAIVALLLAVMLAIILVQAEAQAQEIEEERAALKRLIAPPSALAALQLRAIEQGLRVEPPGDRVEPAPEPPRVRPYESTWPEPRPKIEYRPRLCLKLQPVTLGDTQLEPLYVRRKCLPRRLE